MNSRDRSTGAPFLDFPPSFRRLPGAPSGSCAAVFCGTVNEQLAHVSPWERPYGYLFISCVVSLRRRLGRRSVSGAFRSPSTAVLALESVGGKVKAVSFRRRRGAVGWVWSSSSRSTSVVYDSVEVLLSRRVGGALHMAHSSGKTCVQRTDLGP